MEFGIYLFNRGPFATVANMEHLARRAEALGFTHAVVNEHIAMPTAMPGGNTPTTPSGSVKDWRQMRDYHDPVVMLAHLAACTHTLRLGTSVIVLPYHNPLALAKTFATLDVVSGGRMFLGVGAGWWEAEFRALGLGAQFPQRGARTDEGLRILRRLWSGERAEFAGEFHRFEEIEFSPLPVQRPGPPIWVGNNSRRVLRRVAELGDVWHPTALRQPGQLEPEGVRARRAELAAMAEAAGRDPAAIGIALRCALKVSPGERSCLVGEPEQIAEDVRRYEAEGVTHLTLDLPGTSVAEVREHLERIGEQVLPLVGSAAPR